MLEWKKMTVGDLCDTISETYHGDDEGVVLINTSDVLEGKVLNHQVVENKNLKGQFKKTFKQNDILYSEIRPANKRYAFVNFEKTEHYIASTKLMVLRPREDVVRPRFLFSFLSSKSVLEDLQQLAETRSGTFPQITFSSELAPTQIDVPDLETQDRIVGILDAIAGKISTNSEINNNLEQQAQVLYENTFCVLSDIATKSISLSDLMDYAGGSQPPASEFINIEKKGYIRFVQIRDYDTDSHITYIPISSKNKICEEHDIMIARYGASLGRICFGINGAYNVALAKVFPKQPYFREFLRCYLSSRTFYEGINNKGERSAQAGFNQSDINSFIIDFPIDEAIVKRFENTVSPIFEQRLQLKKENQRLKDLRDTLLPRLMSGELDVSEIDL